MRGFIYFLESQSLLEKYKQICKIGKTNNLEKRLLCLNNNSYAGSRDWKIIKAIDVEDYDRAERKIHQIFKSFNIKINSERELFLIRAEEAFSKIENFDFSEVAKLPEIDLNKLFDRRYKKENNYKEYIRERIIIQYDIVQSREINRFSSVKDAVVKLKATPRNIRLVQDYSRDSFQFFPCPDVLFQDKYFFAEECYWTKDIEWELKQFDHVLLDWDEYYEQSKHFVGPNCVFRLKEYFGLPKEKFSLLETKEIFNYKCERNKGEHFSTFKKRSQIKQETWVINKNNKELTIHFINNHCTRFDVRDLKNEYERTY